MMKLSSDANSPHYMPGWIPCTVLLDGNPVKHCTFADDEEGYVIVHKVDDLGNLVVNGNYLVSERVDGKVEIVKQADDQRRLSHC